MWQEPSESNVYILLNKKNIYKIVSFGILYWMLYCMVYICISMSEAEWSNHFIHKKCWYIRFLSLYLSDDRSAKVTFRDYHKKYTAVIIIIIICLYIFNRSQNHHKGHWLWSQMLFRGKFTEPNICELFNKNG